MDGNGDCVQCTDNCLVCKNEKVCQRCNNGYYREVVDINWDEGTYTTTGYCDKCSDNCATCMLLDDICTTCISSKRLKGIACIGRFTVRYQLVIDAVYQEFIAGANHQILLDKMSEITSVDTTNILLKELKEGSVAANGDISADDQAGANSAATSLSNNLNNLGVTVTSGSFDVFYDDAAVDDGSTDGTTASDVPVGIIVGCTVGGVVLIAIIVFVVWKVKSSKAQDVNMEETNQNIANEKENTIGAQN